MASGSASTGTASLVCPFKTPAPQHALRKHVEVALVSESEFGPAALRGVVAAMAMTGLRTVTVGLGLLPKPPPVEIATEGVPMLFSLVPPALRSEGLELAHWAYGAAAGAAFGALPLSLRCRRWAGPTYGLGTWRSVRMRRRRRWLRSRAKVCSIGRG
jgi:hypothetical protein